MFFFNLDTDSFLYQCLFEGNIYDKLREADTDHVWLDTSNYPPSHPNFYNGNKMKPGLMKVCREAS